MHFHRAKKKTHTQKVNIWATNENVHNVGNDYERKVVWYIKCAHERFLPLLLLLIFIQFYICSVHKLTHGRCTICTMHGWSGCNGIQIHTKYCDSTNIYIYHRNFQGIEAPLTFLVVTFSLLGFIFPLCFMEPKYNEEKKEFEAASQLYRTDEWWEREVHSSDQILCRMHADFVIVAVPFK